jgi:hypothetical protein
MPFDGISAFNVIMKMIFPIRVYLQQIPLIRSAYDMEFLGGIGLV